MGSGTDSSTKWTSQDTSLSWESAHKGTWDRVYGFEGVCGRSGEATL